MAWGQGKESERARPRFLRFPHELRAPGTAWNRLYSCFELYLSVLASIQAEVHCKKITTRDSRIVVFSLSVSLDNYSL